MDRLVAVSDPETPAVVRDGFRSIEQTGLGLLSLQLYGEDQQAVAAIEERVGVTPPASGTYTEAQGARWFWTAPTEWLIAVAPGAELEYRDFLAARLAGSVFAARVVTDSRIALELSGERVREVLARGSTVDFDPGSFRVGACVVTQFAGLRALIACERDRDGMLLLVDRSAGDYLANWLEAASRDC